MPYILSPLIHTALPGLWGEGLAYQSEQIYKIDSLDPKQPPVNYHSHTLKPHSIPHIDAPGHIIADGATVEQCVLGEKGAVKGAVKGAEQGDQKSYQRSFYGKACVVKLKAQSWVKQTDSKICLWRVGKDELLDGIERVTGKRDIPEKLFLSAEGVAITSDGFHDPNFVFVLSEEAARLLVSADRFNAFGNSWKSNDFQPGSRERPIHKILFEKAVLFECLKLDHVPEGEYFFSGFPLLLKGATESPLTAVLYRRDELVF